MHTVRKYGAWYPVHSWMMSVMRAVEQSPKTCTPVSKGEGAVTR